MKKIAYILLTILIIYLGYNFFQNRKSDKELKQQLELQENIAKKANDSISKLNSKVADLTLVVEKKEAIVDSLKSSEAQYQQKSNYYRKTYIEITKEKPKTVRDTIDNLQRGNEALLGENSNLKKSNTNLREQVVALEGANAGLKEVIDVKDLVIAQKDTIINANANMVLLLKEEVKSSRWKGRKEGSVFGVIITIVAVLLI